MPHPLLCQLITSWPLKSDRGQYEQSKANTTAAGRQAIRAAGGRNQAGQPERKGSEVCQ